MSNEQRFYVPLILAPVSAPAKTVCRMQLFVMILCIKYNCSDCIWGAVSTHIKFLFPVCWMLEEMKTGFQSFVYVVLFPSHHWSLYFSV